MDKENKDKRRRFAAAVLIFLLIPFCIGAAKGQTIMANELDFEAFYFNTFSYIEEEYPQTHIFRDEESLKLYFSQAGDKYTFDKEFIKKYSDSYFKDKQLILLVFQFNSGGTECRVEKVSDSGETLNIALKMRGGMTCDMAGWHVFLETDKQADAPQNIELSYKSIKWDQEW